MAEPGQGMLTGISGMVGCYRGDPRLLSTNSVAATGEGPVSSHPGSGVSQPCLCQMAPEVPRWGGWLWAKVGARRGRMGMREAHSPAHGGRRCSSARSSLLALTSASRTTAGMGFR